MFVGIKTYVELKWMNDISNSKTGCIVNRVKMLSSSIFWKVVKVKMCI